MKIKSIEITNVKGIQHRVFNLDLVPNKPNLLVAPNGFGKSSFGIAFDSLKRDKIDLDDKHYHANSKINRPAIRMVVEDGINTKTLVANDTSNTISDEFDVFVINCQLTAKATLLRISGTSIAKPSMEIAPIVLISSIPSKVEFGYNHSEFKRAFGASGKILPNITTLLQCHTFLFHVTEDISLNKFEQVKISRAINSIISEIKIQTGTTEQIKNWIQLNKLIELQGIEELNKLAQIICGIDSEVITDEVESFLAAFQLIELNNRLGADFKKACKYVHYLSEKEEYKQIIKSVNSTRIDIKPKEDRKKGLIVEFPKAHEISNGQRDVLSFITLLLKARRSFHKRDCILIIDEIFDYLDDANLISFQYFITNLIEDMKSIGKNFFPILMTHLDPMFFNNFCFNKHRIKVVYIKDIPIHPNPNTLKLIRHRENPSIQTEADKHHFHFHPSSTNLSTEFGALGLPPTWGDSNRFHQVIRTEVAKYLNDQTDYDPLSICFGVRVRIEYLIYSRISDPIKQQEFIDKHGTANKLEYCEEIGLDVPETYYLLGIIYNDRLHWHDGLDIIRPVAIKLENLTIKKLIRDIFN